MKLQEIFDNWAVDSDIDTTNLFEASIRPSKIHQKWLSIWAHERIRLRKLKEDMKLLRKEKNEFYSDGPCKEYIDRGWVYPARGKLTKQSLELYMDADPDISKLCLEIGAQEEKIKVIDTIVDHISQMRWNIKNALDAQKRMDG